MLPFLSKQNLSPAQGISFSVGIIILGLCCCQSSPNHLNESYLPKSLINFIYNLPL